VPDEGRGVLTLNGSVTSYYFKQVAQRLAMGVLNDSAIVVNDLQVEPWFLTEPDVAERPDNRWWLRMGQAWSEKMLVLRRKVGERIMIGDSIEVVILRVRGGKVRLGFSAPPSVRVDRQEARRSVPVEAVADHERIAVASIKWARPNDFEILSPVNR
jgi:carbon storage regulator